ncbi:MAG: hypothetical protein EXS24_05910 [Pedosphaera sp.]|nr:hypothetical protein [Pedosphaera sp.]
MKPGLDICHSHPTALMLREWKRLTLAESRAIQLQDWAEVQRLQDTKAQIRAEYEQLDPMVDEARFRPEAQEVLALEQANLDCLSHSMQTTRAQILAEDKSIQNIQQVQRAYGSRFGTYWQQYT